MFAPMDTANECSNLRGAYATVNACSTAVHAAQAIPIHPDASRRASGATVHGPSASGRCRPSATPVVCSERHNLRQD
eukprot:2171070-Alexandrium_andersonii.AAC.1